MSELVLMAVGLGAAVSATVAGAVVAIGSTHFVPWHAIIAISAYWIGTPIIAVRAILSPDTRVRGHTGRFGSRELRWLPTMVIRTAWLATDPATVYHALSFYGSHPDLRAELGAPDALDRISNGQAVGEEEP